MNQLTHLSATEAIELFKRGEVTPLDVLEAQIEQIQKMDPQLNAVCETMFDQAREQAAESARRYQNGTNRPLEGITVAVKEKHQMVGHHVCEGSQAWDGYTPTENAPIIERLRAAGAILHIRTTTPEFSIAPYTHSNLWGVTRNPWNPDYSTGGSSGGSAAALASGMTTLATASDIGGSTRASASFNGLVGFKAPYGRIPGIGPMSLDTYRGDGPLARTIDDTVLFTNIIAGPHPQDPVSLRPKLQLPEEFQDVRGMRIALSMDLNGFVIDEEVVANTQAVAQALRDAGAVVEEVDLKWSREMILGAAMPHFAHMMTTMLEQATADKRELLSDYSKTYLDQFTAVRKSTDLFDGVRQENAVQLALSHVMQGYDALICPTSATKGFPAGDTMEEGVLINDVPVPVYEALLTTPFNICNRAPVLAIPSGISSIGVPTGVQIVGHTYDDATVFRIGKALEKVMPWNYDALLPLVQSR